MSDAQPYFHAFIVPDNDFGGTKLVPELMITNGPMSLRFSAAEVLRLRDEVRMLRDALKDTENHRDRLSAIVYNMGALLAREASK